MNFLAALHLHQSGSMPLKKNIQCCQLVSFSLWPWAANMTWGFLASLLYFSSQFTLPLSRMTVPTLSPISLAFFFLIRWLCLWSSIRTEPLILPEPHLLSYVCMSPQTCFLTGCKWNAPAGLLPEARAPTPDWIPFTSPRSHPGALPYITLPPPASWILPFGSPHAEISHY